MTVDTCKVFIHDVPAATLDYLRPHAWRAGHTRGRGAVVRYALAELERRLKAETHETPTQPAAVDHDTHPAAAGPPDADGPGRVDREQAIDRREAI